MITKQDFKFKDRLIKGISPEGFFKISVVKTTELVADAKERHQLSLLNTVLLGRTLTASLLIASELKGEERIRLRFDGSGPSGMIMAEANSIGEVRGYVQHPEAELDYSDDGVALHHGLGHGLLSITKTLYNEAEPRTSTIVLVNGDITSDIAHYLTQSEQIPSAVMLDVTIGSTGNVEHAGGLLIQRLPGAPDEVVDNLQEKLASFPQVAEMLQDGFYIDDVMEKAVEPFDVQELNRMPVHFFCRCKKARILNALSLLSLDDLIEMQDEPQEIVCHFCSKKEVVSKNEINNLIEAAKAKLN